MSTDLEKAKAKLAANRKGKKGDKKQTLTQRGIDAIMAENKARGGSDVGEKRQSRKKSGVSTSAADAAGIISRRHAQTTDAAN